MSQPLRARILSATSSMLVSAEWDRLGIKEISTRCGVSRQTVYNLFGTRAGLAQALVAELLDELIAPLGEAPIGGRGDAEAALAAGFESFFGALGAGRLPLLALVDEEQLVRDASGRLAVAYRRHLPDADQHEVEILARAVSRVCLSYLASPPFTNPSRELARVFAPYVEAVGA